MNDERNVQRVGFAAIDPFIQVSIPRDIERETRTGGMVQWGDGNCYPDYLYSLYCGVPTLQSVIDGNTDYICGDGVECSHFSAAVPEGCMNRGGETAAEQVRAAAADLGIFGGFALQVIRDAEGRPAEIYRLDIRYLRTDKECSRFWYSEKWGRGGVRAVVYPAFRPNLDWGALDDAGRAEAASSVLYVKDNRRQTYPRPRYASAVKACETERCIDEYHLNSLENGFYGSMVVNFNNGYPGDEQKAEIEREFNEKFSGAANAGRIMFSWNRDMNTRTTFEAPEVKDFGDRYDALAKRARQEIFTAFRANPNLFGIPTDGNGFANEQYEESFRLYNRTQISPMQKLILNAYAKVFGSDGVLRITPFSLGTPAKEGRSDD